MQTKRLNKECDCRRNLRIIFKLSSNKIKTLKRSATEAQTKTRPLDHGGTETRRKKINGFLPDRCFICGFGQGGSSIFRSCVSSRKRRTRKNKSRGLDFGQKSSQAAKTFRISTAEAAEEAEVFWGDSANSSVISRPTQRVGPALQPARTSASSATSAFHGFALKSWSHALTPKASGCRLFRYLRALLACLGEADGNSLLAAVHRSAFTAFAGLKRALLH